MRGRPRTPTKVLKLRGSFRKHPEREKERANEPEVTAKLGPPPDCLDEAERARWAEIRRWCPWLAISDRIIVEQTCQLWMLQRKGKASVGEKKLLQSNLTRIGMTSADRSRVSMPAQPEKGDTKAKRFFG